MPGAAVSIDLNGPPWAWPVLGSKVSVWLGPPVIQSRMHDFRRFGSSAAEAARVSIQPEAEAPMAPAEASRITWRRVNRGALRSGRNMVEAPSREADGRGKGTMDQGFGASTTRLYVRS